MKNRNLVFFVAGFVAAIAPSSFGQTYTPQYNSVPQYNTVPQYQSVPQYNTTQQYNNVQQS